MRASSPPASEVPLFFEAFAVDAGKFRGALAALVLALAGTCALAAQAPPTHADPASDAPEARVQSAAPAPRFADYAQALAAWQGPEALNDWIGAYFEYDMARALALSESQRRAGAALPSIHEPAAFHDRPQGICVDLARFAVETLRRIAPGLQPAYVMIEFEPARLSGQVLRRHWVAAFQRDGAYYFFADSKRPGVIAGPYASTGAFVQDYARYRGREVVAFATRDSYERQRKRMQRSPQS